MVERVLKKPEKGNEIVLSMLAGKADETDFMVRLPCDPDGTLKEYYTLTQEEKAALVSGNIQKIESWVDKLDKCLSTWLLYRLSSGN
jgi:hypothetical protein